VTGRLKSRTTIRSEAQILAALAGALPLSQELDRVSARLIAEFSEWKMADIDAMVRQSARELACVHSSVRAETVYRVLRSRLATSVTQRPRAPS
jgi:hypothetical protein